MVKGRDVLTRGPVTLLVACLAFACFAQTARGDLYSWSGLSSVGTPVSFEADLSITGNILTVVLRNTSPATSSAPNDPLSSFYFDIFNGATRPTLAYVSATGNVYLNDVLQTAGANLMVPATNGGWQFKDTDETAFPFLGFGIGTVGNNTTVPPNPGPLITDPDNQFQGSLVGGINYSIYAGDNVTHNKLVSELLVKEMATFTFSGVSGFTNADLGSVAFGLGTGPDSLHIVPLPAAVLLGALGLGFSGLRLRKYV